jgi:guanylate kinase
MPNKHIILLIGESGSGKSYMEAQLCKLKGFHKAVSSTTRPKRKGEVEGVDYYFYQKEGENRGLPIFPKEDMAEVTTFADNLYGVSKSELLKAPDGEATVLVVEPNGAKQILDFAKEAGVECHIVYFDVPKKERMKNMAKRGDSLFMINERIKKDDIAERWKENKLRASYIFKKTNPDNVKKLLDWWNVTKLL